MCDPLVIPWSQDAGNCDTPEASGLILFEDLNGNAERYCVCDQGLCGSPPLVPATIPAGQTPGAFTWTGRNWWGPSDTGNPLGDPFPAGTYTLEVSAIGTVDQVSFSVSNTFTVTLTN